MQRGQLPPCSERQTLKRSSHQRRLLPDEWRANDALDTSQLPQPLQIGRRLRSRCAPLGARQSLWRGRGLVPPTDASSALVGVVKSFVLRFFRLIMDLQCSFHRFTDMQIQYKIQHIIYEMLDHISDLLRYKPQYIRIRKQLVVEIPVSIVVSIPACHAGDRGSIPRLGDNIFFVFLVFVFLMTLHTKPPNFNQH